MMIPPARSPASPLLDTGSWGAVHDAARDAWSAYPPEAAAAPAGDAVAPPRQSPRLLQAASALLRALAAIQCADEPPAEGLQALHDGLAREVVEFCRACDRAGVRHEHMLATRYALCTALDEALSCKPWAGGEHVSVGPWSRYALLQEFHQEGEGGKTVFLLIGRLAAQPQQHREVLEVMLHILALGFMGDYRRRADGQRELDGMRQHLLVLLGGDVVPVELAPHARLPEAAAPAGRWRLPWWLLCSGVVALMLLASARVWSSRLETPSRQLRESLLGLGASIDTALKPPSGAASPPPVVVADPSDLQAWLREPVRAGQLELLRDAHGWRIRFAGDRMFETGSSTLNPQVLAVLRQVADALRARTGAVLVDAVLGTLDVYLMLHDPRRYDARRLHAWALRHDAGDDVVQALDHPAGIWQEPSPADAELVRHARAWLLRCSRGQRLWYLVRTSLSREQEPPSFNLAALQAGQAQRSFELASGRPADAGVPGWYTERAWRELLAPRLPELAARAAADDDWLLGESPNPSAAADATASSAAGATTSTTSPDTLAEELRHAYWLDYARHWSAFLGDIRPTSMPGLEQQLQLARAMASRDSPLVELTRKVWQQLRPLQASDTAQGDPVAKGLLALRPFGDEGADGQPAQGLLEALQAFASAAGLAATETAAGQVDAGAMEQARARLVAQAGALPAPLGGVLSGVADDTAQRVLGAGRGLARKQAEQVFARLRGAFEEQVAAPCARNLAGHFPLSRQGPDANLDDFVGFFGPGGSAQRYFDNDLKLWVDSSRRPWRYRPAPPQAGGAPADGLSPQATQELVRMLAERGPDPDAFARIARVRSALWRQDGVAPSWNFDVSVPSMDSSLTMLRLQVDGQVMRYAHGPVQAWAARWPGPQPAAGARLRLEPADGSVPIELSAQGPWAWMHVLAAGRRRPAGVAGGADLEFGPAQHPVVLHLGGAEPNPWNPGVLEGFTCPR